MGQMMMEQGRAGKGLPCMQGYCDSYQIGLSDSFIVHILVAGSKDCW
jgi:hypothetical protein